ncbi:MAG: hypothetical protein DRQ78_06800 [Epsilonproteobacteria bacterium]|nr:MAG: hypothetical protein DRQ78_06800 [Campylobacterota bacterium]
MKKITFVLFCLLGVIQAQEIRANVVAVSVSGEEGTYRFSVTLKSDETGCAQYADWWEVLNGKGELLYRRILAHSHPTTQPFTRSGGKVNVKKDETIYVRAHMNTLGYVGDVMQGKVGTGFKVVTKLPEFDKNLAKQAPLPKGCAF